MDDSIANISPYERHTNYLRTLLGLYLPALSAFQRCRVSKLYQRVREARSLTKLTQEALAGELGVTRSAVAQWEMAEGTAPSVENLSGLAKRSGMAFEYLATGRGDRVFGPPVSAIAEEPAQYHRLDDQQRVLLARFDTLAPRQRSGLLDLLLAEGKTRRRR